MYKVKSRKDYYNNGQLEEKSNFKDGLLISRICWGENNKQEDCWFLSSETSCDSNETFELRERGNMEYDSEEGRMQLFCVYRTLANNTPFSGVVYETYANGELRYQMEYKKGKYTGLVSYYNDDGSLYCEIKYKMRGVTKITYY